MRNDRPSEMTMWYDKPATDWIEALPIGNGRLGAMVFGSVGTERLQLNEETIWTGSPYNAAKAGGADVLGKIRELVFAGKNYDAHDLFGEGMLGDPVHQQKYQPLGDLTLDFGHDPESASDYRRDLDLETATMNVSYRIGEVMHHRTVLASAADDVIVVHLRAGAPGEINFTASLLGGGEGEALSDETFQTSADGHELILTGKTGSHMGIAGKVEYEGRVKILAVGGETVVDGDTIRVSGADEATLLIAAATNFLNHEDLAGDPAARVRETLDAAVDLGYAELYYGHLGEYQELFDRVTLQLETTSLSERPTDERIKNYYSGRDPQLAAVLYQFGRYLLISCSRPGNQPANLQGIWNHTRHPSWDSKFTTNINLQMNYWPAEAANLGECVEPLVQMVQNLAKTGADVAKTHYGASGWVLHQNTDIWMSAAPMGGALWGPFATAGAWLCTHLFEHYLYSGDAEYLADIYPLMKGSAQFFLDTLVEHPKTGKLVTCPSTSPENFPATPGNGKFKDKTRGWYPPGTTICAGSTIDMQILRDLFGQCAQAAEALGCDTDLIATWHQTRDSLAPMAVGRKGNLQEWMEDVDDLENRHRHPSHMYGVYPSDQVTPEATPGLAEAAKVSLNQRGDGSTGFGMAWKAAAWARLANGERAHNCIKNLISIRALSNGFSVCSGTPQVDGTFGGTAAIGEMLLQSHGGVIRLLPAIPAAWSGSGSFSGLRARGGVDVSATWADGLVTSASVAATIDGVIKLLAPEGQQVASVRIGQTTRAPEIGTDAAATMELSAGEVAHFTFVATERRIPEPKRYPAWEVPQARVSRFQADFTAEEFRERRNRVFDHIGPEAHAVLQGASTSQSPGPFRQENQFYYLCGVAVPGAYLMLDGATRQTTLYIPNRPLGGNPEHMPIAAEDARYICKMTGIEHVKAAEGLNFDGVKTLWTPQIPGGGRPGTRGDMMSMGQADSRDAWDGRPSRWVQFRANIHSRYANLQIENLTPKLDEMRDVKSPAEIKLMRRAGWLSAMAVCESMRQAKPGMTEMDLEAITKYVYCKHGARRESYTTIAAAGRNSWHGHYEDNDAMLQDGDWVLIDCGPDMNYYTTDIGRMFPANGTYNVWQRELYGFVVEYHKYLLAGLRPGRMYSDVVEEAKELMMKLCDQQPDPFSKRMYKRCAMDMMEGTGGFTHPVGMSVHDVASYRHKPLHAGQVIAMDPMIWVREERTYIRIEDAVLITPDGCENLTAAAPTDLDDVEALMKQPGRFPVEFE